MTPQGTPAFTGLVLHQDKKWAFSFWYPDGWRRYKLAGRRQGVSYGPNPDDPSTSFSVEVKNLKMKVTGDDLNAVYDGFIEGLLKLPDCQIAWQDKWVVGALVGVEAKYTFTEKGQTRRRWVRLLYETARQFHIVAQGATPEDYVYWEPMLFEAMATVKID